MEEGEGLTEKKGVDTFRGGEVHEKEGGGEGHFKEIRETDERGSPQAPKPCP